MKGSPFKGWGSGTKEAKTDTETNGADPLLSRSPGPTTSSTAKDAAALTTPPPSRSSTSSSTSKKKSKKTPEEQIASLKEQIASEKAGKRKLFHSLVKLANELRKAREEASPLEQQSAYWNRNWYDGGLWRAPDVLPGVGEAAPLLKTSMSAVSLSDLFFNLVTVTAFTRVGVSISQMGYMDVSSLLYFAVFWTVWCKEAAYATRFDTSDLSAQMSTLVTCFLVLGGSLSTSAPMNSTDGSRIMLVGGAVAILHAWLHVRVLINTSTDNDVLARHIRNYCWFNLVMNGIEASVWMIGVFVFGSHYRYRWAIFTAGVVLALRVPRAFLANDFHAACSKRSVLFILLLGFLLQSIVVVASEFFEYQTPTLEDYAFIGSACLMFFCIKLLYVDDSHTLAEDHALLVNRWAAFFFHFGQFCLLLSTTVMGSGLNLLTHSYLAATAALPGPAKNLVCGGFSAVLFSTFFIKSMHLKRVPTDPRNQALFIGAYVVQSVVLLAVVVVTAAMCFDSTRLGGFLEYLMNSDIELLVGLSLSALFVVMMSWLDEGVELALYQSAEDSRAFRIHPFGFWWCLKPDVTEDEVAGTAIPDSKSSQRLSALSPLLGSSAADIKKMAGYDSMARLDEEEMV